MSHLVVLLQTVTENLPGRGVPKHSGLDWIGPVGPGDDDDARSDVTLSASRN